MGLGTLLVATVLVGWGLKTFLYYRRAYEIVNEQRGLTATVSLILTGHAHFGPVYLAGQPLPTSSKYAKGNFITVAGYAIMADHPHPGPIIESIVALDPEACRVEMTLNGSFPYDWLYQIPVQDIRGRFYEDGTLEPLRHLPHLRFVWINWPTGEDKSKLATLGELTNLELLAINGPGTTELGDGDLRFLRSLTKLKVLAIGPSGLTNAVLDDVVKMPHLRTLCLPGCPLTDDDLRRLADLPALRRLELDSEQVSDEAVAELQRSNRWLMVVRLNELTP